MATETNQGAVAPLAWHRLRGFVSEPAGVSILATEERASVEIGDRLIVEMRLIRPDRLALVDEAFIAQLTERGPASATCPLSQAETWAREMKLQLPGSVLAVGDQLVEAWREHVTLCRQAREQAPRLVEIAPSKQPLTATPGRRG